MQLTGKGRHAVQAMLDLAINHDVGAVTLAQIHRRQYVSQSYLEQIFALLRKRGLVRGTRGPGGGYRLARPASSITVADIIEAVEWDVSRPQFHAPASYPPEDPSADALWHQLEYRVQEFLGEIDLAMLMERRGMRLRGVDECGRSAENPGAGDSDEAHPTRPILGSLCAPAH